MLRAVLAPIAGYAVIGVLVIFTDQLFSLLTHSFDSGATPPHSYFLLSLVTDSVYTALGGYFCAAIAQSAARRATLILILGGKLIGGAVIALWNTQPHWFAIGWLLLYPPALWAGSRFRMRGEPAEASL
jgi:hypothetical protein